ncbi:MAG: cytochrome C oxidase subunit IV family protein [Chloroflexi bacterium]|nr:cytochrome C oxidase subunit IV family protein [Chloroflexota bacterium]
MQSARRASALRRGLWVILALAVLTTVEYLVPVVAPHGNVAYLVVFALAKAGVIAHYFMHVTQLWREHQEEE